MRGKSVHGDAPPEGLGRGKDPLVEEWARHRARDFLGQRARGVVYSLFDENQPWSMKEQGGALKGAHVSA